MSEMKILSLAIPLILNVVAVWNWRGSFRYAACIPLPFLALAFVGDVQMVIKDGNLAGLLTAFACIPSLIFLLVLAITRGVTQKETTTPALAAVSAMFMFVAVLLATYSVLYTWNRTGNTGYWTSGIVVAFAVAGLSCWRYYQREEMVAGDGMKTDEPARPYDEQE
jgi:phosphotransferase system  glucose/maltose/N-acetylglucosamine-specific IIC component